MKESKVVKTCDRCKYMMERKRGVMDYIPVERDGFHKVHNFDLCTSCYNEYLSLLQNFMKVK